MMAADPRDYTEWHAERLSRRLLELCDLADIPHGPERQAALEREAAYIDFELKRREQDGTAG